MSGQLKPEAGPVGFIQKFKRGGALFINRNTNIKHIIIPNNSESGDYIFHLILDYNQRFWEKEF